MSHCYKIKSILDPDEEVRVGIREQLSVRLSYILLFGVCGPFRIEVNPVGIDKSEHSGVCGHNYGTTDIRQITDLKYESAFCCCLCGYGTCTVTSKDISDGGLWEVTSLKSFELYQVLKEQRAKSQQANVV
eukprot:TRINITY_DN16431_c0_g1_i1.p1 TRINITY_DN16431_c0_g1~~TRINITY_DN16431_c0_g1_i1.p1  ORF type:complete len:131 (-),score=18.73 TRINITY_DN16431_c0_g1_i1:59-451(-)